MKQSDKEHLLFQLDHFEIDNIYQAMYDLRDMIRKVVEDIEPTDGVTDENN